MRFTHPICLGRPADYCIISKGPMHYYFYLPVFIIALLFISIASYALFAWYRVHKRMWHLCFRVGLLARSAQPPLRQVLSTHPLPLFFFGRLQHLLHREITRLEDLYRVRSLHSRPAIWPGEQLRYMTARVDQLERALTS